ncbi:hypothetical protein [Helicobacter canis]|uniref:Uncharacterized protein n=1 Tax=Helicobacter canis NCTC 12740 TaxID=1357399 RepID=V8CFX7_9HELI|nr:hypothetical protein [Helicobacter canis]ETD25641.1 hypothetical protein HMPREF2087_01469 [Helicobacter canis NCTC 12740]
MKLSPSLQGDETFPASLRGSEATAAIHKDKSQKVDSNDEAFLSSLRGSGNSHNEAIHKNIKSQKVDSRIFTQTAQSLSTPQGKKAESVFSNQPQAAGFLMKKRGCAAFLCGDKPSGLSHKQKANSSLFRKKPTPTLNHTRSKQ